LIVLPYKLDWGNGEQYPLDLMLFYKYQDGTYIKHKLPPHETSQYKPKNCIEYHISVFVRDPSKRNIAQVAF